MREIIYRAWDNKLKDMQTVRGLSFDKAGTIWAIVSESKDLEKLKLQSSKITKERETRAMDLSRYELMQFTGLPDKNKKKIFEGDIVKCISKQWWPDKEMNYLVVFYNGSFKLELQIISDSLEPTQWYYQDINKSDCVIIGDKFNNPGLLEKDGVRDE